MYLGFGLLGDFFFGFDPRDEFHPPFGDIFFGNFFFQALKSRKSKMIGGGVLGVGEVWGLSFFFKKIMKTGLERFCYFFGVQVYVGTGFLSFFFLGGLD